MTCYMLFRILYRTSAIMLLKFSLFLSSCHCGLWAQEMINMPFDGHRFQEEVMAAEPLLFITSADDKRRAATGQHADAILYMGIAYQLYAWATRRARLRCWPRDRIIFHERAALDITTRKR